MLQVIPLNKDTKPRVGYKLVDLGTHWELRAPTHTFRGDWLSVKNYAIDKLDFPEKELEIGRAEMWKKFDNAAEYGIFKSFMWTFSTDENSVSH